MARGNFILKACHMCRKCPRRVERREIRLSAVATVSVRRREAEKSSFRCDAGASASPRGGKIVFRMGCGCFRVSERRKNRLSDVRRVRETEKPPVTGMPGASAQRSGACVQLLTRHTLDAPATVNCMEGGGVRRTNRAWKFVFSPSVRLVSRTHPRGQPRRRRRCAAEPGPSADPTGGAALHRQRGRTPAQSAGPVPWAAALPSSG